jgi:hypothetical protein
VENEIAIGLKKNGDYMRLKNNGSYTVGCEIEIQEENKPSPAFVKKIASMAAACVLFLGVGGGAYSYYQPYTYIDVDINPSIEITANRYDRVLKVEGFNEDGKKIVNTLDIKNGSLEAALESVLFKVAEAGYLKTNESNDILITISATKESKVDSIENEFKQKVVHILAEKNFQTDLQVEKLDINTYHAAKKTGLSPGKLHLIKKLQEKNSTIQVEDYKSKPVKEIMKKIKDIAKAQDSNKNADIRKEKSNKLKGIQQDTTNKQEIKPEYNSGNRNKPLKEDANLFIIPSNQYQIDGTNSKERNKQKNNDKETHNNGKKEDKKHKN